MRLNRSVVFVALAALVAASSAAANNTGIFGKSGRNLETTGTCTQCHLGANTPEPTVTVSGLEGSLTAGGFAELTITVKSTDPNGGLAEAACPNRCAGINAAVDTGAGAFLVPDGSPLVANPARDEVTHVAKIPFDNGEVSYTVLLTGLAVGEHTLFVAGADVNGQDSTGDRIKAAQFSFSVESVPPPGPADDEGGCANLGGGTGLAALALLALLRRRRGAALSALSAFVALAVCSSSVRAGEPGATKAAAATSSSSSSSQQGRNHMEKCPSAVRGAVTSARDVAGGVEVKITGGPDAVPEIRARAKALASNKKDSSPMTVHDGRGEGGGKSGRCPVVMHRTAVTASDVDGGALLVVKPDQATDLEWLRNETMQRIEELVATTAGHGKMGNCPSAVDGSTTTISDLADGVVVTVVGTAAVAKDVRARTAEILAASKNAEPGAGHAGEGQGGGGYGRCPVVLKDTALSAKDVDGGSQITVKPRTQSPATVAELKSETRARAARLAPPPAPAAPASK